MAAYTPTESFYTTQFVQQFMERVTNLTEGRVQFEYYPAKQLEKAADSLSLVSNGVADISLFTPNYIPSDVTVENIS